MDDLKAGSKAEKSYDASRTAIRSFNFWWQNHDFEKNKNVETSLYAVQTKYADMLDGFQALCSASHTERNIMFSHYVTKMMKRVEVKSGELSFVLGKTKRVYLTSIQRGMHMYEHQHNLTHEYGDWSWTKSGFYRTTKALLKKVTIDQEIAVSPSKLDKSSDYMTDKQFDAMHKMTWNLSKNPNIPFGKRLEHKQSHFIQGLGKFECLRGRDEIANCLLKEFEIVGPDEILFQMKRGFKSLKLGADYAVRHKDSLILKGERYLDTYKKYLLSTRPMKLAAHLQERIFLKPVVLAKPKTECWWQAKVQGKTFCSKVVSTYVNMLVDEHHPLFGNGEKFTNSSIRKYHNNKLAEASAPIHIQQASLGQNTRFYNKGPKSKRMDQKRKVADVVSGKRTAWHSPANKSEVSKATGAAEQSSAAQLFNTNSSAFTITETSINAQRKLRFSFQAPNANINFEYDVSIVVCSHKFNF